MAWKNQRKRRPGNKDEFHQTLSPTGSASEKIKAADSILDSAGAMRKRVAGIRQREEKREEQQEKQKKNDRRMKSFREGEVSGGLQMPDKGNGGDKYFIDPASGFL